VVIHEPVLEISCGQKSAHRHTDRHTPMTTRPCGLRRAGNDFPENQLTKFCAVWTVKANWNPHFCKCHPAINPITGGIGAETPAWYHGQSPCQGVASSPPLLPEADSFSWMVVRPYGIGKLKLAPFLVFDRKHQKVTFRIPVSVSG